METRRFFPVNYWKATGDVVKVAFGYATVEEAFAVGKKMEDYGDNEAVMVKEANGVNEFNAWADKVSK